MRKPVKLDKLLSVQVDQELIDALDCFVEKCGKEHGFIISRSGAVRGLLATALKDLGEDLRGPARED